MNEMTGQTPEKTNLSDEAIYGVAIFDNDVSPTGGWSAVGGASIRKFGDVCELSDTTLWWSNIPDEAFQSAGLSQIQSLRPASYLTLTPNHVLAEWGYDPKANPRFTASFASVAFGRIMRIAARLINDVIRTDNGAHSGQLKTFASRTLAEDLRPFLASKYEAISRGPAALNTGGTMRCHWPPNPRLSRALEILEAPFPSGNGTYRELQSLPIPVQSFLFSDAASLSWSAGVVSEAIAQGVRGDTASISCSVSHRKKDLLWNLDRMPLLSDEQRKHLLSAFFSPAIA